MDKFRKRQEYIKIQADPKLSSHEEVFLWKEEEMVFCHAQVDNIHKYYTCTKHKTIRPTFSLIH